MNELKRKLEHARAAYIFAIKSLPELGAIEQGEKTVQGFTFSRPDQVRSMVIELGWAFYARYESCLEFFLKQNKVELSKKKQIVNWLEENSHTIPDNMRRGLDNYRKIRNTLHHQDGASFDEGADGLEVHLLPEHMEAFFELFCWVAERVDQTRGLRNKPLHVDRASHGK